MNRDEAKFILRARPLDGAGADDPQFREALALAKRDGVLAEWFAREEALDTRLSEKFRAFPVPPGLKRQLLAARGVMPPRTSLWRQPWLGLAACLAVVAALTVLLWRPAGTTPFAEFRAYVEDTTAKLDHLDVLSRDVTELRRWLQNRGAPGDFVIPASLNGRPSIGCRVFEWRGQLVSLVCFNIGNGQEVHLFVIDRARLGNAPNGTDPQFAVNSGIATASWRHDRSVYVLATDAGERTLKHWL